MSAPQFPFTALVGLDTLKLALQLAAIDRRLSVVVRGDKGAGKSTAARGLADLLEAHAPFITLPIGATEDRLLGGLDVEKALKGEPSLKLGLLAEANGGVLYVDEVNLLPDHLADALLDAVASGVHIVEREGFSASQSADFVLLGSMNPEEGALRPQLLDRFALAVNVEAPSEPAIRCEILERRLAHDRDPEAFTRACAQVQEALSAKLTAARARVADVNLSRELLEHVSARVAEHEVRSLRADLAVVRASRAYAALDGSDHVTVPHVEAVLPLALAHRMDGKPRPPQSPSPSPLPDSRRDDGDDEDSKGDPSSAERVFEGAPMESPRLVVERHGSRAASSLGASGVAAAGPVIASRRTAAPRELDLRPTLLHTVTHTGAVHLRPEDLHERVRQPRASTRFIVIVDSSGSHAVRQRMRLVKGAVSSLLEASHGRHDEVVVIACRGAAAQVLVEPTSSHAEADRALAYLPTGGRTPLAHALELAAGYVTDQSVVVLVTDGHANVPRRSDDAWGDALAAAAELNTLALVIDTEDERRLTGRPKKLAVAMRATCLRLADLDQAAVVRLIREVRCG
ncbi:MAG: VWA domain-containing protein [Luteitalea sp.]|nr:VWA domain-containing protein [Luteitalea sp.]